MHTLRLDNGPRLATANAAIRPARGESRLALLFDLLLFARARETLKRRAGKGGARRSRLFRCPNASDVERALRSPRAGTPWATRTQSPGSRRRPSLRTYGCRHGCVWLPRSGRSQDRKRVRLRRARARHEATIRRALPRRRHLQDVECASCVPVEAVPACTRDRGVVGSFLHRARSAIRSKSPLGAVRGSRKAEAERSRRRWTKAPPTRCICSRARTGKWTTALPVGAGIHVAATVDLSVLGVIRPVGDA
jgi:hypothetical protein